MFEEFTIKKSAEQAEAWLQAVVTANGGPAHVSYPEDCERIVQHFSRVGGAVSDEEAAIAQRTAPCTSSPLGD
ncbi:hypothetical protein [Paraburkholderia caribensis]|uniref:hypothetical protein n=1 Tax=Paraburkholderia caribensis TaxID=75105 RepID=UPI0007200E96|nr:hypothetical protein [Paraburkholderia caribensis]ALP68490.1 hypothetical protein AN416_37790 [Paraburkholderia caribensis]AUT57843.1 hypothetical protein C2L66_38745 [Paraburkholderia caribensis]